MVSVPTAATAPFVVRANRRIEKVPVTSGMEAPLTVCSGAVGVAGGFRQGVVGWLIVGVVGGSIGWRGVRSV